jgi:hypothetical protein
MNLVPPFFFVPARRKANPVASSASLVLLPPLCFPPVFDLVYFASFLPHTNAWNMKLIHDDATVSSICEQLLWPVYPMNIRGLMRSQYQACYVPVLSRLHFGSMKGCTNYEVPFPSFLIFFDHTDDTGLTHEHSRTYFYVLKQDCALYAVGQRASLLLRRSL